MWLLGLRTFPDPNRPLSKSSLRCGCCTIFSLFTSDEELLTLFASYGRGGDAQKKTALQKLLRIFLTIDVRTCARLLQRLSAPQKTDIVSQRFQSGLPASERATLLAALRLTR